MEFSLRQAPTYPNPFFSRPLLVSKPLSLKPFSRKPPLPLRASHNSPKPSPKTLTPLSSLFKPFAVAATAAVAILLAGRFPNPSLASAAAAFPSSPTITTNTAVDSETLADDEKERLLEEHLASNPDDVKSLRALMEAKVQAKKLPEAIEIVDRLIALEPDEKDLPLLKAHLQSYNGDAELAKQAFEEILQKDPFLVEAYHGLVMAASHSEDDGELDAILMKVQDAMELCKKAKKKEELRDFKLLVAQIMVVEGKYEDSLRIYKELVKEEPRDFRPHLCQGIIYTLLRKKDEAEKHFQKYRRLVPKGHPYAQYFDDNMMAMKVFGQMEENKRKGSLKN
ncbi:protein SLOW GREEN 1, chloroplastic-like [Typha angustifolia]|uniref:protein SLOW GREEN 1, chloroplastic-like n=1 Tax=Typha angustifolia TaxID=59011 RepID=UPI003C2FB820